MMNYHTTNGTEGQDRHTARASLFEPLKDPDYFQRFCLDGGRRVAEWG